MWIKGINNDESSEVNINWTVCENWATATCPTSIHGYHSMSTQLVDMFSSCKTKQKKCNRHIKTYTTHTWQFTTVLFIPYIFVHYHCKGNHPFCRGTLLPRNKFNVLLVRKPPLSQLFSNQQVSWDVCEKHQNEFSHEAAGERSLSALKAGAQPERHLTVVRQRNSFTFK